MTMLLRLRQLTFGAAAVFALAACDDEDPVQVDPTGSLTVTVAGLPAGTNGAVTVTGPNSYNRALTGTQTISSLPLGNYTVAATEVSAGTSRYTGTVSGSPASVSANGTANVTVTYALATGANGSLQINVSGLPQGTNAAVAVAGPGGYAMNVTGTTTLAVAPGSYTVASQQVTVGTIRYTCTTTGSPATITSSTTTTVTVVCAIATNPTIFVTGSIAQNRRMTPDTNYVIRGFVYVNSGATLTIDAGTRIEGDSASDAVGSALFVLRGARIVANGTEAQPIVMTSRRPVGSRTPGDWGGLILVGNARASRTGNIIVEGSNGSVLGVNPATGIVYTGGTVDTDNSGTLRYVRVEFAGYATLANAELNSFTLAAVGSGTTLEYLQSVAGLDDSFEWFGGTVDGRYLVSYESGDDHFDASEGYRGRNQFMIALQTTFLTPRQGAGAVSADPQGFEIDGCSGAGCIAPSNASAESAGRDEGLYNMPVFANFTVVGTPPGVTVATNGGYGMVLRRGTGGYYLNGVVARWPRGAISLRDSTANNRFLVDSLVVRNLYFAESGTGTGGSVFDPTGTNFGQETAFTARNSSIVIGGATNTTTSLFTALPDVGAATTGASFDWTPPAGSPIATGGLATFAAPLSASRLGTFITPTAYRGAAAPGGAKWWVNWTAYARN